MTDGADLAEAIARLAAPRRPEAEALRRLVAASRPRRLAKGEHLCRQGDPATSLFHVRSGLLRYYYLAEGVEHTGQFFDAGMFVADVAALTGETPAVQNIEALAASEVHAIPRAALLAAYDADHALERFGRRVIEEAMGGSQRRSAGLLLLSPEQRYERFVRTRPEVARRVPLFIVASYLGITPEALSRIRRRRVAG
jgi:CRP-like cAMP-binding protein